MYLITNKNGKYLKETLDSISFVSNVILAEKFNSQREASDYIIKHFPKKKRRYYRISFVSDIDDNFTTSTSNTPENPAEPQPQAAECLSFTETIQQAINTYLSPDIDKYKAELKQYDDMILDIRHYIRDENTNVNACIGFKIFKRLQSVERKRVICKKELQRLLKLQAGIQTSITESENFEYEPYRNRIVTNMLEFIDNGEVGE